MDILLEKRHDNKLPLYKGVDGATKRPLLQRAYTVWTWRFSILKKWISPCSDRFCNVYLKVYVGERREFVGHD
jgi:hypothetical protein